MPWAVVSNSSSTLSFSVCPRMNCWMGASSPGMAISAIWALFERLYWVGLYWTSIRCWRPFAPSMASVSVISITRGASCISVPVAVVGPRQG